MDWTTLKYYFDVDNSYVLRKVLLILFPFYHDVWRRKLKDAQGEVPIYFSPREDINAPDLYVPLMALVSYIVLLGVAMGIEGDFRPERLGITSSYVLVIALIELFVVKFGSFIFGIGLNVSILDITPYVIYKYVAVNIILIVGLLLGFHGTVASFLYLGSALMFFLLRSFRNILLTDDINDFHPQKRRHVHFLFFVVILQIFITYFLVRNS